MVFATSILSVRRLWIKLSIYHNLSEHTNEYIAEVVNCSKIILIWYIVHIGTALLPWVVENVRE